MKKDATTGIIAIIALILVVSLVSNIVQYNRLNGAVDFSSKVSAYLSLTQKECPSNPKNFTGMASCMDNLVEKLSEKPVLVEAMFVNYYMSTVQSKGVLIFKNIGTETYESSKFRLFLNRELQDSDGCDKKGSVSPDALCSLNFYNVCGPGDALYVEYDGRVILGKSC